MVIIGAYRSDGDFKNDKNETVVYDNVYVFAVSGENEDYTEHQCSLTSGHFTDVYKMKTDIFLAAFKDLQNPFEECKGLEGVPFYDKKQRVTGFLRTGKRFSFQLRELPQAKG